MLPQVDLDTRFDQVFFLRYQKRLLKDEYMAQSQARVGVGDTMWSMARPMVKDDQGQQVFEEDEEILLEEVDVKNMSCVLLPPDPELIKNLKDQR